MQLRIEQWHKMDFKHKRNVAIVHPKLLVCDFGLRFMVFDIDQNRVDSQNIVAVIMNVDNYFYK